ncbi:hypothetical protein CDG76_00625 [Nostoc sp. 'Peltigera membranacea cyanobiont' 210A]|uniref:DUF5331 domain-containing protein n=1 Tax=Nostoc sp. 'Peltigera membranacea cyanobiont' 210A TaxID=2014529 RepID=UPI000B951ECE|nr:DUF5331 domain-containing protein [Nostoc sp. 'Peltigera membranacea cyanobiont' 210A]OYD97435.1 hypothetical protein CDG76_00625 [Nostoc sp. 'Peltigera membranacea cyanobiont' 210A]
MNIQQLRQSLKQKWLIYYKQNTSWLVKMRIWATYDGLRRPLSGFILATLSVLEPQFDEILAFMMDLNNDPDKIVAALGLNFNPDEELRLIKSEHSMAISQVESESPDEKHSEDKHLSSAVTASKIALHSLAKTLDSNLSRADELVPSITATTEVVRTRKPELIVANATKIAPDTPAKTPASGLLRKYQPVRWHSGQLPSGASATMTSQVNSKAKTMPSVALATEVKSNAPSGRIPVGASLAITTEINSNGKSVRSPLGRLPSGASLAITTEVKSNDKQPNIQPQEVKSKVNLPTTNARSIASWVDEFCYGARDKEKDILI